MREKHEFTVLAFATNDAAMKMEQYCQTHGIPGRLIPLPEEVSAGCGIAWRMEPQEYLQHRSELEGADFAIESITPVQQWIFLRGGSAGYGSGTPET